MSDYKFELHELLTRVEELEKLVKKGGSERLDNYELIGGTNEQIIELEENLKALNINQGQCFEKRGQFTNEIAELRDLIGVISNVDIKQLRNAYNELKALFTSTQAFNLNCFEANREVLRELIGALAYKEIYSGDYATHLRKKLDGKTETSKTEKKEYRFDWPLKKNSGGEKVKFICGGCGKEFESYHDGIGYNTGFCPPCLEIHETIGLDSKPPEHIKICWQCKNAQWGEELGFYEILCTFDKTTHDENSGCDNFVYNPNHSEINPRIKPRENEPKYKCADCGSYEIIEEYEDKLK